MLLMNNKKLEEFRKLFKEIKGFTRVIEEKLDVPTFVNGSLSVLEPKIKEAKRILSSISENWASSSPEFKNTYIEFKIYCEYFDKVYRKVRHEMIKANNSKNKQLNSIFHKQDSSLYDLNSLKEVRSDMIDLKTAMREKTKYLSQYGKSGKKVVRVPGFKWLTTGYDEKTDEFVNNLIHETKNNGNNNQNAVVKRGYGADAKEDYLINSLNMQEK